ncbi:Manganese transport system membrane protein MntB [Roseovarius sp. EC-HK134]|jgi:manganese/zinc/iron transport system permease protein|uniref:Manganese transport system membrane protein MntB n=1 Tax=Roseovarius mucosus TaxID=215743 RepID=A0A1V0RQN4_9RHOB|nr:MULTISPECIES: metal ABC transporter permease [Roseovarius]ARE84084.1 manganese transport system membrane protein MntB [Roseovarius mucosus]AWZ19271.1 Manganese ABC transporter, inner membrane permease protein SitC [Roseovarius sp. AK1035]EDM33449.1 zinc/manganese/iron ABC transporter, permease protein [Roseovarius sp. TM1035]VVT03421.1 Manganese transport system membrane protein MntB [Roseovarius sp. EC-HK134]VVT03831.1 Manganese transport system membrane protein MntB [Roseovarius sp. EC-SD
MLWDALTLQLGYNATLVTLGAAMLGVGAGATGTYLYLGKRALVSDAISHATLPGVVLGFMVMVALGGEGRFLPGLMLGAALSAVLGLLAVTWLTTRTRLHEDAAIGAVLSVFFGFGVVLLTVVQVMDAGRQAGLETFLLGATAGMLRDEALTIAAGGVVVLALVRLLHRPMILVAFDPDYAVGQGMRLARVDLAMMGLALAITVTGLKVVGLVLIVALLIIPPVAARFWSERAGHVVMIAGAVGGVAGYLGAAFSATAPDLPTGPLIVLAAFALFVLSLLMAPGRGVLAAALRHLRFQRRVHLRQGLLALAAGQPVYEPLTLRLMRRAGLARADGVATEAGRAMAARARLDERRWQILRSDPAFEAAAARYDGLTPLDEVLTGDQIAALDRRLGPEGAV